MVDSCYEIYIKFSMVKAGRKKNKTTPEMYQMIIDEHLRGLTIREICLKYGYSHGRVAWSLGRYKYGKINGQLP